MTAARRRPPSWARRWNWPVGPMRSCSCSIWPPPGCPVEPGAITAPRYEDQAHYERPTWASEFLQRACYVNPPEEMRKLRLALTVGDPAAEIIHSARDNQADLIVLCWRGDLGGNHTLVVKDVFREMPCPLLILRASQTP